mmetsp:Transcript_7153/g.21818  ORF Transcript_7153/g.21818 Transcript_7153/m.21818 type:complete len:622 (+) Transcript_7153:3-1868(+)
MMRSDGSFSSIERGGDFDNVVLEVVSEYSDGDTTDTEGRGGDWRRFEDVDEVLQGSSGKHEMRSLGGMGWKSSGERMGAVQVTATLLQEVQSPHPLEKLAGKKQARELREDLKKLFKEMHRLVGFDTQSQMRRSGNASQEILRSELRTLAVKLKQVDPAERMTNLRELLRKRKEQEEEIENLELRLSNVLTSNRHTVLKQKATDLQRVFDFMQTELESARNEKDEHLKTLQRRRKELSEVDGGIRQVNDKLSRLESTTGNRSIPPANSIVARKFREHYEEQLQLERDLSRGNSALHSVRYELKELMGKNEAAEREARERETELRDLRARLVSVNHRIADKELKISRMRNRTDTITKRTVELQMKMESDHAALRDQIQDLNDVQRSMIAEVHDLHGDRAGAVMERLAERNERNKKSLLSMLFHRKPSTRIVHDAAQDTTTSTPLDGYEEDVSDNDSVRTSRKFERGLLSRLSSRDRSRERRLNNAKQSFTADSLDTQSMSNKRLSQHRREAGRKTRKKAGKEDSKRLYVRNLDRARVEENRSIHFLEACVQQREKAIAHLDRDAASLEAQLEATEKELASAEVDKGGRLMVKNFNSYNEEVALQEIEKISTRVGPFPQSLFI